MKRYLLLLLIVAGCKKTINTGKGEELIHKMLLDKTGAPAEVDCPKDVKAKKGDSFLCKATFAGGVAVKVKVEQTDDEGNVNFLLVDGVVLSKPLEEQIAADLKGKGIAATADCGDRVRLSKPGATFTCAVKAADGHQGKAEVEVKDDQGNVSWRVTE